MGRESARDWFLERGLPWLLARRDRDDGLLRRAAPTAAALAVFAVVVSVALAALGDRAVDEAEVQGTFDELVAFGLIAASLVLPAVAAWSVARLGRTRWSAVTTTVVFVLALVVLPFVDAGLVGLPWPARFALGLGVGALVVLGVLVGVGSVAGWAVRFAVEGVGAVGTVFGRMLPLLMITLVIFFTGELWQWSAAVERARVWWTVGVLVLVAVGFLVASTNDEFGRAAAVRDDPEERRRLLTGTPFAADCDRAVEVRPLRRREALNLRGRLVLAQFLQAVAVTAVTFGFFVALGWVMLPDRIVETWSAAPVTDGTWFGIRVPLSQAAINMALFAAVLSGLNFTVSSSTDPQYRVRFLDPIVEDAAVGLVARDVYRGAVVPDED